MSVKRPAVGAAFAGGGARGLAHLGVLKALEEEGVRLDVVVGTSMGGLVAGLYAAGVSLEEMLEFQEKGLLDLVSIDPAGRGLSNQEKLVSLLADLLGSEELTFEELGVRAAVVATDIQAGEMVILDRGPLIPALAATAALPLLFAPVRHQGRWLVDGGVFNNLPVDVARSIGADRVLGVDVPSHFELSFSETGVKSRLPRTLWSLANGELDWKQPFLVAEASMGMTAQMINRTRVALCPPDLLLEVDLPNVGVLSDDQSAEIVQAGYEAARTRGRALAGLWRKPLRPRWQMHALRFWARLRRAWTAFQGEPEVLYPGPCSPERLRADLTRAGLCFEREGRRNGRGKPGS